MSQTFPTVARWWRGLDRPGWRRFAVAMATLGAALLLALFSAAVAEEGRVLAAGITAAFALALAGWVGVTVVPALARRSSLRWFAYQVDYRLPRAGVVYLVAVFVLIAAALNTGNNLLFLVLGCLIAGILISGVLSPIVLAGMDLRVDLPEHIFAEQPVLAEVELRNEKELWPSLSLSVVADAKSGRAALLPRPVFFPYIPRRSAARQKVETVFPRRGVYGQSAFGIRTRFPFGFLEKTRRVDSNIEITVYPRIEPPEQFYEILPLLSGEMASYFRGRGHELHSLRDYVPTDSARVVDWKVTARAGRLTVREFAREDERRVILVLDPFTGPPRRELGALAESEHQERFERAVSMAARIAWHFHEMSSVMQFRTDRFETAMAPASEVIYSALRELAVVQADFSAKGGAFIDGLSAQNEAFKIVLTSRPQASIPTALWSSSYFLFMDRDL